MADKKGLASVNRLQERLERLRLGAKRQCRLPWKRMAESRPIDRDSVKPRHRREVLVFERGGVSRRPVDVYEPRSGGGTAGSPNVAHGPSRGRALGVSDEPARRSGPYQGVVDAAGTDLNDENDQ